MTAPGWWYRAPNGLVCAPPKCGLVSLKVALTPGLPERLEQDPDLNVAPYTDPYLRDNGLGYFTDEEVIKWFPGEPRYLAIRQPASRFRSLWRDKCSEGNDPDLAGLSPNALMDRIQEYPMGDHHWMPQFCFILPGTILVRYDKLHETVGLPAVHTHRTVDNDQIMPVDRIQEHYRNDVDLWAQVKVC